MESNSHAGTGAVSCQVCGRRFTYSGHRQHVANDALAEHECDGHPIFVIGTLKNMLLDRDVRIDGEWGDGRGDRVKLRDEMEDELETRLREQRMRAKGHLS